MLRPGNADDDGDGYFCATGRPLTAQESTLKTRSYPGTRILRGSPIESSRGHWQEVMQKANGIPLNGVNGHLSHVKFLFLEDAETSP